ncbi:hypothetical protein LCGC14_0045100 [marine sediment metagenome]|uniref:Uncharacterized protein n=2 Tax=root TaxID=1 RepID=A0A7V1BIP5_9RHOB|nr:hypothetical protein [Sulfitobacter litoralis]HDZ53555.1 hypothetical protein [Sulfitobacter litoralis]
MVLKFIKSVLIILGLVFGSVIVSVISPHLGFYLGLALLIVPLIALIKPLPQIGLGHRGFSFSVAFFVGIMATMIGYSTMQSVDLEAMSALKAADPEAYLAELEKKDRDIWLTELEEIDPERHAVAIEEERVRLAAQEARRSEEEAERAAQKVIDDAKQAEIVRIAEEKEAAKRAETRAADIKSYLDMMDREMADLKKFNVSQYTSDVDTINSAVLLQNIWVMLYEEGKQYRDDPAVKTKHDAYRRQIVSTQKRMLPVLRDAYGPAMRKLLWEADGSARTIGAGYKTVEFVAASFARNANIKETHTEIRDMLVRLRFTRAQYKWFKQASEYSYYTMDAPSDQELVIWEGNGNFRVVK